MKELVRQTRAQCAERGRLLDRVCYAYRERVHELMQGLPRAYSELQQQHAKSRAQLKATTLELHEARAQLGEMLQRLEALRGSSD